MARCLSHHALQAAILCGVVKLEEEKHFLTVLHALSHHATLISIVRVSISFACLLEICCVQRSLHQVSVVQSVRRFTHLLQVSGHDRVKVFVIEVPIGGDTCQVMDSVSPMERGAGRCFMIVPHCEVDRSLSVTHVVLRSIFARWTSKLLPDLLRF